MSDKGKRENQAFEALFVSSMRNIDSEEVVLDRLGEPSEKEQAALKVVGSEFTSDMLAGKSDSLQSRMAIQTRKGQERTMNDESTKLSGIYVLTVSLAIVSVVVTLLWMNGTPAKNITRSGEPPVAQPTVDETVVSELQDRVNELFPNSKIRLTVADGKINISGRAANPEEAAQIVAIVGGEQTSSNILGRDSNVNLGTAARPFLSDDDLLDRKVGDVSLMTNVPQGKQTIVSSNHGENSVMDLLGIEEPDAPPSYFPISPKNKNDYLASQLRQRINPGGVSELAVNNGPNQHWGFTTPRPGVMVGLDPTGRPTADLDLAFRHDSFTRATPQFGGFDLADVDVLVEELAPDDVAGEGLAGERYERIYENAFQVVHDHPLSTFSIDVDTASYSKTRQYLQSGQLPPPDAVRIEELVNYFPYDYLPPMGADPFTAHMEVSECPWQPEHRLARIAIKGQVMEVEDRPHSNLVFLLDVSGSMNQANKLPLVKKGMKMLVERLGEKDRVAIVTYAGNAGLVLDSTSCDEKAAIMKAIDDLQPGGSTAGAAGITMAYEIARKHFIEKGVNRVLLCTDGDFNVGVSDDGGLVRLAEEQAKHNVFLSILGFGSDNLNDSMLEQVSGKANGMYVFIDTENEARKVLVEQLSGTLVTIAKDVKIQIEFNPAKVKGYRLIGYENRMLAAEDFNDDRKDAGEIGAGHNVTALYEIVPADAKVEVDAADIDDLKYQKPSVLTDAADSDELLTLKLRFKQPDGDKSSLMSFPIDDDTQRFAEASDDFQFAAAVASFGMLLRGSRYAGDTSYDAVHEIASASVGDDEWGYRKEFVELVAKAKELAK